MWMYEPSMLNEFFPIPYSCPKLRWGSWVVLVWIFVSMILTSWAIKARIANSCDVCDHEFWFCGLCLHTNWKVRDMCSNPLLSQAGVFRYDNNCVSNLVFETHYSLFSLHHLQKATRHPNPSLRIAGKQTLQPYWILYFDFEEMRMR
jgi:heterodisulfide reductase subunit B